MWLEGMDWGATQIDLRPTGAAMQPKRRGGDECSSGDRIGARWWYVGVEREPSGVVIRFEWRGFQ
jgi:hypothetical protein